MSVFYIIHAGMIIIYSVGVGGYEWGEVRQEMKSDTVKKSDQRQRDKVSHETSQTETEQTVVFLKKSLLYKEVNHDRCRVRNEVSQEPIKIRRVSNPTNR